MFRGTTPRSRVWQFGLAVSDYMLVSLLWTYGPFATSSDYDIIIGLMFEPRDIALDFVRATPQRYFEVDRTEFIARYGQFRLRANAGAGRRLDGSSPLWEHIKTYLRHWHVMS